MWLTVVSGIDDGTRVEIAGGRFILGRGEDCDLVVDDEKVSRHHTALEAGPEGTVVVQDLGSSNGTFVNGRKLDEPATLRGDEHIRIGDTVLVCSQDEPHTRPEVPVTVAAAQPSAGVGRSTVQRLVLDAVRNEDRRVRRRFLLSGGVALVALAAAVVVGALFLTGTFGGSGGTSVAKLERATVLVEGLDESGQVSYIGSGSIIRSDGLILTNAHVGAPTAPGLDVQYGPGTTADAAPAALRIALFDGEAKPAKRLYLARPLAYDGYADVAVLKIVSTAAGAPVGKLDLPTVAIGDSNALRDGEAVAVVGYPGVGGGFERAINVSRGTISGFQRDSHIDSPRGWIKTDAAIAHGNSGGLAADPKGRLIGIPSRTQCGSSLMSGGCDPGEDVQGKIRPIALALPVIRAAEAGRSWTSPYVVQATGKEDFTLTAWAKSTPSDSCEYDKVTSYEPNASSFVGVFQASGLAAKEDLAFLALYAPDANTESQAFDEFQGRWSAGGDGSSSCYWVRFSTAGHGNGIYSLIVLAGPSLAPVSEEVKVKVGATAGG